MVARKPPRERLPWLQSIDDDGIYRTNDYALALAEETITFGAFLWGNQRPFFTRRNGFQRTFP
jgi:hypothetical protein